MTMTTATITQRELHRALRADARRWEDDEITLDLAGLALLMHEASAARAAGAVRRKLSAARSDARAPGVIQRIRLVLAGARQ